MSTIGSVFTLHVHQDPATDTLVLESLSIVPFTNDAGADSVSVVKNDYPSTKFDSWIVKTGYLTANIPPSSTTLATLLAGAATAIHTVDALAADGNINN
jgi:hypothetical protein